MRGQKRLEEIRRRLLKGINKIDPENAGRYDIKYEAMTSTHVNAKFLPPPGYQFLLVDKENPNESYRVRTTTYGDLIRPHTYGFTPEMDEKYSGGEVFEPNIQQGIEYLGKTKKEKRRTDQGELEKTTAIASILGILGGLFFLSSNITGNAIANVSQSSSNALGAVLLVVGLVTGFFWLKGRKPKSKK